MTITVPHPRPDRPAVTSPADEAGVLRRAAQIILIGAIPLQRFGLQLGSAEIAFGLLMTLGTLGFLVATGRVGIDANRLALFGIVATAAAVSSAVNAGGASAPSFALVLAIYLPFTLVVVTDRAVFLDILRFFQDLVLLCAMLGALQFGLQFAVTAPWLFTFRGVLPDAILLEAFNTASPLAYGSPILKSNGFLLLEPSMFSQYLALALLVEILFFARRWRVLAYAAALPISYSGTGLLLLAVFLPLIVVHRRAWGLLAIGVLVAAVAIALGDLWNMDALVARAGELQSTQTSGFARFVSAFWLLDDFVVTRFGSLLVGLGPGSISEVLDRVPYEAHDPTWGKLLFEYGVVGTLAFAAFFLACVFPAVHSAWVSGMLLFGFLLFGGMLLDPRLNALLVVFCTLQRRPPPPEPGGGGTPRVLRRRCPSDESRR